MAPSPLEKCVREDGGSTRNGRPLDGNEVVISGISGVFPSSESTKQFMENLYNKVDMVLPEDYDHPEIPKYLGKIDGVNDFDAQFFRVTHTQARSIEPMSRMLMEHAYGAMFDAGVNPIDFKGKKVGVFAASSYSDCGNVSFYATMNSENGLILSGISKTMFANRVSYWLDGKGPSYTIENGCTSSMTAMEHGRAAIMSGVCDAAIVAGTSLCFHPKLMLNFARAGVLCKDGKTKCFDKSGDGYVRAEAINVLFLQRAKDAKRIYAELYDCQVSYGIQADTKFLTMRNSEHITKFLDKIYSRLDVSPSDVEYVEAHGAAIAEEDAQELEAIKQVFGRENDVKVGCLKSNMGNSEAASAICAVTKLCLAYHSGVLPANLHYSQPCVPTDRLRVLSDNTPFERGITAVNQFSFHGSDAHLLLKGHYKPKDTERYKSSIPKLMLVSGRQEDCVNSLLDALESQPIDPEQYGLLNNIFETDIPGHMCRGYSILDTNEQGQTESLAKGIEFQTGITRPLWVVYSGMGSQWAGMGKELMKIPIFAAAIERCHKALEPKGIDLVRVLTDPDEAVLKENILHSFVGISAVQIGLTDIVKALGIVPDNIIGHSMGEMGCGYFDGSFTCEQTILAAYYRGLVSKTVPLIHGKMAAVGLGYNDILPLCPPEIDIACHNSADSVTVSGPADAVTQFITDLKSRGIFAKGVESSNLAYHSRYIKDIEKPLLTYLKEVIKNPKPRSSKWISTSVPQAEWDSPLARDCSAAYHTNNSMKPVLFEEVTKLIPSNAVIVEVAPHGLLQAILKRSHPECTNIALTRRLTPDPVKFLFEAIGKLYQEGFNPKVSALYPQIEFPVSTETPLLSHLVKWEHSEKWPQAVVTAHKKVVSQERDFVISLYDDEYKFIEGHVRNGEMIIPEAAILCFVWETLAMYRGEDYRKLSVTFSDVHFVSEAIFSSDEALRISVMINKGNDKFEVSLEDRVLARGSIIEVLKPVPFPGRDPALDTDEQLHRSDIYQLLGLRGYAYKDDFQSILSSNLKGSEAKVEWKNNWVTLLDSLMQLNILAREHSGVSVPKIIKHLHLNMVVHRDETEFIVKSGETHFRANYNDVCGLTRCAGVEMKHVIFDDKRINELVPNVLETQSFIPHVIQDETKMDNVLQIQLQIVADNVPEDTIQVACIPATLDIIKRVSENMPSLSFHIDTCADEDFMHPLARANVLVVQNVLQDVKTLSKIHKCIDKNTFILTLEQHKPESLRSDLLSVVSVGTVTGQTAVLLKKAESAEDENVIFIPIVRDDTFSWVPRVHSELLRTRRVVLISEQHPYCGLFGLVKKLRKEYKNKIGLVAINDSQAPSFDPEKSFYKEQLQKNLAFNIFKKGEWGGYYRLPVTTTHLSGEANEDNVRLTSSAANGLVDAVSWTPAPHAPCALTDLQVCFAGPSMRDAQKMIGLIESNDGFGMDFSGIDARGTRMMGLVSSGALASHVPVEHAILWPVPAHWSLREAATVPLPYAFACYCLVLQTQLRPGQRLLVTEGAEPLGQACIALALRIGASVFATVDDIRKKHLLLQLFPELDEKNIGYTHRGDFLTMKFYAIENRCDIVINCYSGDLRKIASKCVKDFGIFLDLNDYDIRSNKDFDMAFVEGDRSYKAIQFANVFRAENSTERKNLQQLVSEGVALGWVRPLPCVELLADQATRALRLVASKRLSSCMLLRLPVEPSSAATVPKRDGVTLLLGAEGELAAALVQRLVRLGARHLLMSKRAITKCHTFWKKLGVTIAVSSENLQTEASCLRFLREGEKLGPVQEIYIAQESSKAHKDGFDREDFVNNFNKTTSVVKTMDLLSKNNCPELRKFVVVMHSSLNVADEYTASVAEKICEARSEAGLPALVLRIEHLNPFTDQSVAQIAQAASLNIRKSHHIVTNMNKSKPTPFILKITEILGVKDIDEIDENLTLEDLNVSEVNVEEMRASIKGIYKIDYTEDSLKKTSIASLKRMTDKRVNCNTEKATGLGAFYSYVEREEYLANEAMIYMRSLLSGTEEEIDDIDAKESYLMLIPGFEGHHRIFNSVCERIKMRTVALQLSPDMKQHTISQMAARLKRLIQKRFETKSKFYLLGYSFGVNVALELAAMLEKEGLVGVVYCLDSSPDALRAQLGAYVGELSDSQLQCALLQHMHSIMAGRRDDQLNRQLDQLQHWSDRVELFLNTLKRSASYSSQYARDVVTSAYSRLRLARSYEPDFKLDSEVVLVRGAAAPGGLADDYNLSKYTRRPVRVFHVPADHVAVPSDCRVSSIINSQLDPHLIDLFRNMNLCQTYLTCE